MTKKQQPYTPPSNTYQGEELKPCANRPNANDHMQYGSLVSGKNVGYRKPRCGP